MNILTIASSFSIVVSIMKRQLPAFKNKLVLLLLLLLRLLLPHPLISERPHVAWNGY